jgi:hypothetical protein
MHLVAQALSRPDLDRLDLETLGLGYDGVGAPRALGMLSHSVILPTLRSKDKVTGRSVRRLTALACLELRRR